MKHLGDGSAAYLAGLLEAAEVEIPETLQSAMLEHLDWILQSNERVNLTAITHPREAIRLHIVDSLLALHAVEQCLTGRLCDIGTGAGFPGIPLALATGRSAVLLESIQKKARLVDEFVQGSPSMVGVHVVVEPVRVEEYSSSHTEEFAVVSARAVSQLGALIELSSPLLMRGGSLVALKGSVSDEEFNVASAVAGLVGMRIEENIEYTLPEKSEARTLVVIRKVGESRIPLPRRTGMAQRDPLGVASRQGELPLQSA